MAVLRSSLLAFDVDGSPVSRRDLRELEGVFAVSRSAGGAGDFERVIKAHAASARDRKASRGALRAAVAAATLIADLEPFRSGASASLQVSALVRVIKKYERLTDRGAGDERPSRARAAVLAELDALAGAYQAHDDEPRPPEELAAVIHHALEARTFAPRRGTAGVHLVDRVAARFGEFDHTHIVGLVETDWSDRGAGNIFYAASLLKSLGWPQDADQSRAEFAGFRDLLNVAARSTRLSRFELDGDAIVGPSPLVDILTGVPLASGVAGERRPVFTDELIAAGLRPIELEGDVADWLALRHARPPLSARAYTGFVSPRAPGPYRVSRVDRYVHCPFKYFAESVLRLDEERDELSGLSPLERGTLLHSIFERFYTAWQAQGGSAITAALIGEAADLFERIVRESLAGLEPGDRALEETRLLGSLVSRGVGERVFELEADSHVAVRDRWLERDLRGTFSFPLLSGLDTRPIEIRGKVDRLDLLDDGSLRVIDYKLGQMPDLESSTQIAVYAHCARQVLEAADGGTYPISAAMYFAFGEERRLDGRVGGANDTAAAVAARAGDFAAAVGRIEAGEFPPQPRRPSECQSCGYAGVCRKEYLVGDDEES
jgi:RecB family exonuclease